MKQSTKTLVIEKFNTWYELEFDKEMPFIFFESIDVNESLEETNTFSLKLEYNLSYSNNSSENGIFQYSKSDNKILIDKRLGLEYNIEKIEFRLSNTEKTPLEGIWGLYYSIKDFYEDKGSIQNFENHINNNTNTKILFSAPYGEGKTTFLNYFFKENSSDYETFRVYPVNYSVAQNEDIFRYIKTDILFQLLGKNVEFDNQKINAALLAQQFVITHPKKLFSSILKIALSLNFSGFSISKGIPAFDKLIESYKSYQNKLDKTELEKTKDYLNQVYKKEGSIYEDDFYTQLIRQLLDEIKSCLEKKTVLIIDDLDRMDPEHIFRILNVISAHYDEKHNYLEGYHNKFGFDKIIVVCHLNSIRNIFEHRYGKKTDFSGYINKFYSTEVFKFSYQKVIDNYFESVLLNLSDRDSNYLQEKSYLIHYLSKQRLISLRELFKFNKSFSSAAQIESIQRSINRIYERDSHYFMQGLYTASLYLLANQLSTKEELINRVHKMNDTNPYIEGWRLNKFVYNLLGSLAESNKSDELNLIRIGKDEYQFKLTYADLTSSNSTDIQKNGENFKSFSFTFFCELLIENIKKF